jgi:hypothetical protein
MNLRVVELLQVAWPQLDADRFVHPVDQQALNALRQIPFVENVIREAFGGAVEQVSFFSFIFPSFHGYSIHSWHRQT